MWQLGGGMAMAASAAAAAAGGIGIRNGAVIIAIMAWHGVVKKAEGGEYLF